MLTRQQKTEIIEKGKKLLARSKNVILVDFSRTSAEAIRRLRSTLRTKESPLAVIKKRLLKLVFKNIGVDFNADQLKTSVGAIFVSGDLSHVAGDVYKFGKENEGFKILGGYDTATKEFVDAATVNRIGQLPPKEVLLAQLLGMFTAPMRKFLIALNEKNKKVVP